MHTRMIPDMLSKQKSTAKLYYRNGKSNVITLLLLISILLMLQTTIVNGLLCYTCTYREQDIDNTCLVDANSTRITKCSKKYCTIMRQEAVSPPSKVLSFIRDCLDKPLVNILNENDNIFLSIVKTDSSFKTFYRSCSTDLCNDSDGTTSATNADPNFGASENVIIKGKRF